MVKLVEKVFGPGEHGPGGGVEILVKRDIDGIEQPSVGFRRNSRVSRGQKQPSAIQMEADLTLPRKSGDPLHLGKIEDFALDPADRGFDRDHPDRRRYASVLGAGGLGLDLSKAEGRAFGGERDECQPAQRLRAISRIIVYVALALDQDAAATLRETPQREVV